VESESEDESEGEDHAEDRRKKKKNPLTSEALEEVDKAYGVYLYCKLLFT